MERNNPITCKTTKSPATAQICKKDKRCSWVVKLYKWDEVNWPIWDDLRVFQPRSEHSPSSECCLGEDAPSQNSISSKFNSSSLYGVKSFLKINCPEIQVLTPQSREGDLQQEGGTWDSNIYLPLFTFYSTIAALWLTSSRDLSIQSNSTYSISVLHSSMTIIINKCRVVL